MSRQKQKREATRDLILSEAEKLFTTIGYEATTIDQIVEKANLAKGTFYYNFKSKEELIEALIYRNYDHFAVGVNQELESGKTPAQVLELILFSVADWVIAHPDMIRIMLEQRFVRISPADNKKNPSSFRELTALVMIKGQEQGVIRNDIDAGELSQMLAMMIVQAHLAWLAFPDKINLKEKFKNCLEVFLNGAGREIITN